MEKEELRGCLRVQKRWLTFLEKNSVVGIGADVAQRWSRVGIEGICMEEYRYVPEVKSTKCERCFIEMNKHTDEYSGLLAHRGFTMALAVSVVYPYTNRLYETSNLDYSLQHHGHLDLIQVLSLVWTAMGISGSRFAHLQNTVLIVSIHSSFNPSKPFFNTTGTLLSKWT